MSETMKFEFQSDKSDAIKKMLKEVNSSMDLRGYKPVNQLVGYLISGDPTYITSHNNARNMVRAFERDEILEVLLEYFLDSKE